MLLSRRKYAIDMEGVNESSDDAEATDKKSATNLTAETTYEETSKSLNQNHQHAILGTPKDESASVKSPQDVILLVKSLPSTLESESPSEKRSVFVRCVFLKVGSVDTVNEKFAADVFVQARWREGALDAKSLANGEVELNEFEKYWNPKLYIENTMGEFKESVWYVVSYNAAGEATINQRRRIKGSFYERMELNQYPFDTQDLTVSATTELGETEIHLLPDENEISTVNVQSFVDEQQWLLHRHINAWRKQTTDVYKSSKHKHPTISISCKATRRAAFFVWNIILVMIFICSLIFTTFWVDQMKPQNRIQLSFILLLSNITFKFSVSNTVPKVSYLTYLDKYILISMAILCFVCVWHAIIGQIATDHGEEYAEEIDRYALIGFITLYVGFNGIFFMICYCLVSRRDKDFKEKDSQAKIHWIENHA